VSAGLPNPEDALGSTDVIEPEHPLVAETAERVAGSASEPAEAARRLFGWVRDEVGYDMAPELGGRADWRAGATLERGFGFCQQKAVALASLLRARGIPAGVCFQDVLDHKIPERYAAFIGSQRLTFHGLTALYADGAWWRVDATLPRSLCERKDYRLVEYEARRDYVLPATDLAGRPHFTLIQDFGISADLPERVCKTTLGFDYLHDPGYRAFVHRNGPPA
jgi:transglutaminase-like putative cysteine protease